jgi:hypothetical protein
MRIGCISVKRYFVSYSFCARIQANYLMWRNARSLMSYLDARARDIVLQLDTALTGKVALADRYGS